MMKKIMILSLKKKKISISGKKFDATNLIKNLSEKNKDNTFKKFLKI